MHLIMIGACYLDTILSVPHFPEQDAKLRATSLKVRRGGNCGNGLEVLQQFLSPPSSASPPPLTSHLVTTLPSRQSAATAKVLSSFGPNSPVDLGHCIHREDQTEAASSYIIHSRETGSRTIVNHNGLAEMTVDEFIGIADHFKGMGAETWWHFEGRIPETILKCIQHIRHHLPRARVSVEVEKPKRDGLRELAAEADVVIYSRSWAEGEGYTSSEDCLTGEVERAPKASLLLCTWGARGATALSLPSREVIHITPASDPAVQIVDAVGAGDTFVAGMLYGLLCRTEDWDAQRMVRFAVDLATLKIQQDGFRGLASKLSPAG
ncbi:Ketohexokinase [Cytospora mali]|uniref:Ketohexokinase n=1 Tax=Cytospora mali TaxID=578113 RepID=A0A194UM77_CYTMA|nr:Ketohexokinase [Valsa mali var. pyri (nom. inval.)]